MDPKKELSSQKILAQNKDLEVQKVLGKKNLGFKKYETNKF